ncbi:MAG: uracil-DNA glycosylase family protein [Actinomycetota bacterium]|nr:uracil-DNA glycosylase family protein [Actinomycetota bacterium]
MSYRIAAEWMGATVETLADLLPESPRAVIVGVNPAPSSVEAGHYYQGQLGQRLWQRLTRCGLVAIAGGQWEDDAAVSAGFGLTDVVKRPTPTADALLPGEREYGAALLREKLCAVGPAAVIFTFKDAANAMVGPIRGIGWIDGLTLAGAGVFVMPGPYEARPKVDQALTALAARLDR